MTNNEDESLNIENYTFAEICTPGNTRPGGMVAVRPSKELLENKLAITDVSGNLFPSKLQKYQGLVGRYDGMGEGELVAVWFEELYLGELFPENVLCHLVLKAPSRPLFEEGPWIEILGELASLSDAQLSASLSKLMKDFLSKKHTSVEVWNFYKELLDKAVNSGGASFNNILKVWTAFL